MESEEAKMKARKAAFGIKELGLLKWLAEDPDGRFAMRTHPTLAKSRVSVYEKLEPRPDGLRPVRKFFTDKNTRPDDATAAVAAEFGGRIDPDLHVLKGAGYIKVASQIGERYGDRAGQKAFEDVVADVYIPGQWAHGSEVATITDEGLAFWNEKGRKRHERLIQGELAKAEKLKAGERRAVFGWMARFDRRVPPDLQETLPGVEIPLPAVKGMRPMFTATIIRETAERLYVRDIANERPYAGMQISRQGIEKWVDRKHLMLDNASEAAVVRLFAFDDEQQADHYERCARVAAEIVPVLKRMADLRVQADAAHADMFAELLGSLKGE